MYIVLFPSSLINVCIYFEKLFILIIQVIHEYVLAAAAAAAKSLHSCPTLCNPIDCSLPGSLSLGFSRQEHWCIYLMIKDDSLESLTTYPVMWFRSQFVQTCLPISCLPGRKLQWNKHFNIIICNTIKKQSSECYL